MRIQVIFQTLSVFSLLATSAFADCFNFDEKIIKTLRTPMPLNLKADVTEVGKKDSDIVFGAIRGVVNKPIEQIYKLFLDHNTTKSSRVEKFDVIKATDPNYLEKHSVSFVIHPFKFLTVQWDERWGYALAAGTPQKPTEIVISYEKVNGTSYISHLCGSIVLRKLSQNSTDVYQYEEAKARQHTAEDSLNGLKGTLGTLRK